MTTITARTIWDKIFDTTTRQGAKRDMATTIAHRFAEIYVKKINKALDTEGLGQRRAIDSGSASAKGFYFHIECRDEVSKDDILALADDPMLVNGTGTMVTVIGDKHTIRIEAPNRFIVHGNGEILFLDSRKLGISDSIHRILGECKWKHVLLPHEQ